MKLILIGLRELRREDDASLPTGGWKSEVKRAEWSKVETLATRLLKEQSKDLMVSVWLGETWLHRNALEGLPEALALISGLCERYPEDLHPQAELLSELISADPEARRLWTLLGVL